MVGAVVMMEGAKRKKDSVSIPGLKREVRGDWKRCGYDAYRVGGVERQGCRAQAVYPPAKRASWLWKRDANQRSDESAAY